MSKNKGFDLLQSKKKKKKKKKYKRKYILKRRRKISVRVRFDGKEFTSGYKRVALRSLPNII